MPEPLGTRLVPDGSVWFKPASDWLALPEPFCRSRVRLPAPPAQHGDGRQRRLDVAIPGSMPGQPLNAAYLGQRLKAVGAPVLAGRMGTWQQLVREAPPSILAEALGISPTTAMKHAEARRERLAPLRGLAVMTSPRAAPWENSPVELVSGEPGGPERAWLESVRRQGSTCCRPAFSRCRSRHARLWNPPTLSGGHGSP